MDVGSAAWKLDEYKQEIWTTTNIGVPHLDIEANDAIILGCMVADLVAEVNNLYTFINYYNINFWPSSFWMYNTMFTV